MRICYLADARSIHTQRWIKYFASKGHDIFLISICPSDQPLEKVKQLTLSKTCRYYRSIFCPATYFLDAIEVKNMLREIEPDILHAHYAADFGIIGAFVRFHPFVISAWGSDVLIDPHKSYVNKILVSYALKHADLITTEGKNTTEAMVDLGAVTQKIALISHGVNLNNFVFKEKISKLLSAMEAKDSPTIISIRSLKPIYGIETLIRAVPIVLEKFPKAKFIIAGEGTEKEKLISLSRSLNIIDSVQFIGKIAHESIPYYFSLSDIYVSTSLSDGGIAVSTIEAMACGLPAIVADAADNRNWIDNGKTGFIFPKNDEKSLAKKIICLCKYPNISQEFAKASRDVIEKRANYNKEMNKMELMYYELIRRNKL